MPDTAGKEGTQVDQIKTPMNAKNVAKENTPGTHSFKKAVGNVDDGGKQGNSIAGPGRKGCWDTQTKIEGSNAPNKY